MAIRETIRCQRLLGELIFEDECEFHPNDKNCLKCEHDLLLGYSTSKKDNFSYHVYTKYPTNGEFKTTEEISQLPGHIASCDLPPDVMANLDIKKDLFEKTGNPVYALEAFLEAHEARLYPPWWVINWIIPAFRSFQKSNGEGNLNRLLGFSKGRGQDVVGFKERALQTRNESLLNQVGVLRSVFNISLTGACKMVGNRIAKYSNLYEKETGIVISKLSWRTLYDLYSDNLENKKWEGFQRRNLKWSEEEKRKYLKQYPSNSYEWKGGKLKLRLK